MLSGRSRLLILALAAVLLISGALLWFRNPPQPPALPNPNGYDDLLKAAETLQGDFAGFETLEEAELRTLLEPNADALKLLRTGVNRECRVPLDYSINSSRIERLGGMKRLALALSAEARLAQLQHRPPTPQTPLYHRAGGACDYSRRSSY